MQFTRNTLAIAAMGAAATLASAGLSYTFDSDDQGWSAINDTSFIGYDGTIGQPNGALRGVDQVSGPIWYFSAPLIDLGNLSGLYGNAISYDILGISGNHNFDLSLADIMLSGGGITIGIDTSAQPVNGQWTSWSAMVDDSSGWELVTSLSAGELSGNAATAADIQTVLADLDGLYIRGEYTSGSDSAALDNVSFVPSPGALAMISMGGLLSMRRRR
jgi:MYXO-CTERM domain-containing protein